MNGFETEVFVFGQGRGGRSLECLKCLEFGVLRVWSILIYGVYGVL
jgi:hypothetical protein